MGLATYRNLAPALALFALNVTFAGDGRDDGLRVDDRRRKRLSRSGRSSAGHPALHQEPDAFGAPLGHDQRLLNGGRWNIGK